MVDFVLTQSGSKQLQFVGHSMGTSAFLVMCSMRPLYNSKIQTAVLLSPVVFKAVSHLSVLPRIVIRGSSSIRVSTFKRHCIFVDLSLQFNTGFLNSFHVFSSKVSCKALKMCAAMCKKHRQLVHSSMAQFSPDYVGINKIMLFNLSVHDSLQGGIIFFISITLKLTVKCNTCLLLNKYF